MMSQRNSVTLPPKSVTEAEKASRQDRDTLARARPPYGRDVTPVTVRDENPVTVEEAVTVASDTVATRDTRPSGRRHGHALPRFDSKFDSWLAGATAEQVERWKAGR